MIQQQTFLRRLFRQLYRLLTLGFERRQVQHLVRGSTGNRLIHQIYTVQIELTFIEAMVGNRALAQQSNKFFTDRGPGANDK
jgi:hypothetical protein